MTILTSSRLRFSELFSAKPFLRSPSRETIIGKIIVCLTVHFVLRIWFFMLL